MSRKRQRGVNPLDKRRASALSLYPSLPCRASPLKGGDQRSWQVEEGDSAGELRHAEKRAHTNGCAQQNEESHGGNGTALFEIGI